MNALQICYQLGDRIKITGRKPKHHGKTGVITGIFCAGRPGMEHYVVHFDTDLDPAKVYHVFPEDIEPVLTDEIAPDSFANHE